MIGITEITKKVASQAERSKELSGVKRSQIGEIINHVFEALRDSLIKNQPISIRGKVSFTLKRANTKPKVSSKCDSHTRSMDEIKRKIKASGKKGLSAYAKSPEFRNLMISTRSCKNCKLQMAKKSAGIKPLNRVIFKPSESF